MTGIFLEELCLSKSGTVIGEVARKFESESLGMKAKNLYFLNKNFIPLSCFVLSLVTTTSLRIWLFWALFSHLCFMGRIVNLFSENLLGIRHWYKDQPRSLLSSNDHRQLNSQSHTPWGGLRRRRHTGAVPAQPRDTEQGFLQGLKPGQAGLGGS